MRAYSKCNALFIIIISLIFFFAVSFLHIHKEHHQTHSQVCSELFQSVQNFGRQQQAIQNPIKRSNRINDGVRASEEK